jgi:hypothetical protein
MFSLLLLHAALMATGLILVTLLRLPTSFLRWAFAIGIASAQLILSIQFLSLFDRLHATELLWTNLALTAVVMALATWRVRAGLAKFGPPQTVTFREFRSEVGILNLLLAGVCIVTALILLVVASAVFPANDPYHLEMCLFWSQNGSIGTFPVHDPRIVSLVFASEAMALPGFLYSRSSALFILHTAVAGALCTWAVYVIARAIGGGRKHAFTAALVFAASTPLLNAIWGAKSDFLLSAYWLAVSLLCIFEGASDRRRVVLLLGCSAFAFVMGCGAKNTILIHGPAYGILLLLHLRRDVFRPSLFVSMAAAGVVGAIASGMLWSYVQNYQWFADWRGHSYVKATLAKDYDARSVWTRLCRSVVTLAYDVGWLPNSCQPGFAKATDQTIQLLGGASVLPEDDQFYEMDLATFKPGAGMGIIGPSVFVPSLLVALWLVVRGNSARGSPEGERLRALVIFVILSFLVFYTVLRTQKIGVIRLMLSSVLLAMPLCCFFARFRIGALVCMAAAVFSASLNLAHGLSFAAYRHQIPSLAKLAALKRIPPETIQIQWGAAVPQPLTLREPYSNRELYALAFEQIPKGATVGFVGEYQSEGYPCFGPDFTNVVVPLNDCRSKSVAKPSDDVGYIVVEHRDLRVIEPAAFYGFDRVFEATRDGGTLFAFFKRRSGL